MELSDDAGHPPDQADSVDLHHALLTAVAGPGRPGRAGGGGVPHHLPPPLEASLAQELQEGRVVPTAVVHGSLVRPQPQPHRLDVLSI